MVQNSDTAGMTHWQSTPNSETRSTAGAINMRTFNSISVSFFFDFRSCDVDCDWNSCLGRYRSKETTSNSLTRDWRRPRSIISKPPFSKCIQSDPSHLQSQPQTELQPCPYTIVILTNHLLLLKTYQHRVWLFHPTQNHTLRCHLRLHPLHNHQTIMNILS